MTELNNFEGGRKMRGKPRSWNSILRQRNRFDGMVNDVMALLMRKEIEPSKRQICQTMGLDYDDANDRAKVTASISKNRELVHYAWNYWVENGSFDEHFQRVADDSLGFKGWKVQKADLYDMMKQIGMSEADIHQLWILSQLWERFLAVANQWNLHVFVAFGIPWQKDSFRYKQPKYWDYIASQVETARRLCKGTITILERHRDLGMILTSGIEVQVAIQTAKATLQMIADGEPPRYKCELCAENGIMSVFKTQQDLVSHYKSAHNT
jgi:hypothetical protein